MARIGPFKIFAISLIVAIAYITISEFLPGSESAEAYTEAKNKGLSRLQKLKNIHHYNTDWYDEYKRQSRKVYSADIQKHWLKGTPILFIGNIEEVSLATSDYMMFSISPSISEIIEISSPLPKLSIYTSIEAGQKLLDNHEMHSRHYNFGASVAVVAKLTSTELGVTIEHSSKGPFEARSLIGKGKLIELVYVPGITLEDIR